MGRGQTLTEALAIGTGNGINSQIKTDVMPSEGKRQRSGLPADIFAILSPIGRISLSCQLGAQDTPAAAAKLARK